MPLQTPQVSALFATTIACRSQWCCYRLRRSVLSLLRQLLVVPSALQTRQVSALFATTIACRSWCFSDSAGQCSVCYDNCLSFLVLTDSVGQCSVCYDNCLSYLVLLQTRQVSALFATTIACRTWCFTDSAGQCCVCYDNCLSFLVLYRLHRSVLCLLRQLLVVPSGAVIDSADQCLVYYDNCLSFLGA